MQNEPLSEKVSVNVNTATLSNIDILVDNGYFSNRSDFINQAVRNELDRHRSTLDRIIGDNRIKFDNRNNTWFVGIFNLTKHDVDSARQKGRKINITGYGLLEIDEDIDDELLFDTVESIRLKGRAACRETIKKHYGLK